MNSILDSTLSGLKKRFAVYFSISAVLFIFDVIVHYLFSSVTPPVFGLRTWGYFMFVISLIGGVGAPILLRLNFQKNASKVKMTTIEGYNRLQNMLLLSVFISSISAVIAYLFPVQLLYLYGSFFSCLYGIYSVIPYKKKIAAELRFYKLI